MAQIRAQLKRAILSSLARQAAATTPATDLLDALESYADSMVMGIKDGTIVEATSQAGHHTKLRIPVLGEHFRQEDVCELSQEFIEVYNDALVSLSAQSISSPTDAQVLTTMLNDDRMTSVTKTRKDYTLVNMPSRFWV